MKKPRILVHAHFFYPNIAPEITDCIRNFIEVCGEESVEIVATYPDVKPEFAALLPQLLPYPKVKIIEVPNRGYDVAPFVCEVLNKYPLDNYDYIVKLHTKRDVDTWIIFRPTYGDHWRRTLLRFCATPEKVCRSLAAFTRHPKLGMLAASRFINLFGCDYSARSKKSTRKILRSIGLKPYPLVSVSGTIFMVRATLLKPLAGRFSYDDFLYISNSNAHTDFALAGDLELAFATCIAAQGYAVTEGAYPLALAKFGYYLWTIPLYIMRYIMNLVRKVFGEKNVTYVIEKLFFPKR